MNSLTRGVLADRAEFVLHCDWMALTVQDRQPGEHYAPAVGMARVARDGARGYSWSFAPTDPKLRARAGISFFQALAWHTIAVAVTLQPLPDTDLP